MCLAAERLSFVLERNAIVSQIVRLIVVDKDWKCTGDYRGYLVTSSQVLVECGMTIQLDPEERVVSPVERHQAEPNFVYWLIQRSPTGDVALIPTPAGESAYFSKEDVDARSGGEQPFFPEMIAGDERWFLEVRAPKIIKDDEDGELSYEEDGEAGPDDSIGPADTIIF